MKKYGRTIIVIAVLVILGLGYYHYLANKDADKDATDIAADTSEVSVLISKDIMANYPESPKDVVDLYARITKAYYDKELTDEQINEQILAKLRMNRVVNSDPEVVERLDHYLQDKSAVIPVEKKKDGSFSARSGILSREEMQLVSAYVDAKIRDIGREILDGKIAANPYEKGNEEACTYCAYKKVCGFDGSIPGYEKRQLEDLDKQTLMQRMQETMEA